MHPKEDEITTHKVASLNNYQLVLLEIYMWHALQDTIKKIRIKSKIYVVHYYDKNYQHFMIRRD